jgi:hypothetical protein
MRSSKTMQAAMDQKFIAGFTKYFGKKTKLSVDAREYTSDQITATVQGRVDQQADVETKRGQYVQAVAAAKATSASTKQIYDDAKQAVLYKYASNPAVLSEFGLTPKKKPRVPDVATKQAAILQAQATRTARHTMGPRQKAKIKGVVTPVSANTSVDPPAASPAVTASAGSNPAAAASTSVSSPVTPTGTTGH